MRPFFELFIAAAAAAIAMWLTTFTRGGLDQRFVFSWEGFGIVSERGAIARDPSVSYAQFDGRQYLIIYFPNAVREANAAVIVQHVLQCSNNYDVHGLGAPVSTRPAVHVSGSMLESSVVDVKLHANRGSEVACQIEVPPWHASRVTRKLALGLLSSFSHSPSAVGHADWVDVQEVPFHVDGEHGNFDGLEMEGGTMHAHHVTAISPEVDQRLRFLSSLAPGEHFITLTWKDEDAQNQRDQLYLVTGALVGLAGTALYDFMRRMLT